ncbi:MAG: hypothetical protein WA005_18490 [Candidatus Binataceae bacterium]
MNRVTILLGLLGALTVLLLGPMILAQEQAPPDAPEEEATSAAPESEATPSDEGTPSDEAAPQETEAAPEPTP